jgi:hypothetical protein
MSALHVRGLAVAVALLATASTGCFSLTIVSGKEPAQSPIVDDAWRSASVLDVVAIDTPLAIDLLCKDTGWSKIHQEHSVLNWLADVFLAGSAIYESTHVDLYCARAPGAPPGAAAAPTGSPPPAPGVLPPTHPPASPTGTPTQPPPTPTAPPPSLERSL